MVAIFIWKFLNGPSTVFLVEIKQDDAKTLAAVCYLARQGPGLVVEPLRLLVPLGYADDAEVSVRQLFLNHVEPLLASRNLWTVNVSTVSNRRSVALFNAPANSREFCDQLIDQLIKTFNTTSCSL